MNKLSPSRIWRYKSSRYRIEASKCNKCGALHYPPRIVCDKCGSRDLSKITLNEEGRVITYTLIYSVPEGFRDQAPLPLAIVELKSGTRILAPITDINPEELKIGLPVEPILRRLTDDENGGLIKYGFKFRPLIKQG